MKNQKQNENKSKKQSKNQSKNIVAVMITAFIMFAIVDYAQSAPRPITNTPKNMTREITWIDETDYSQVCVSNETETYCAQNEAILIKSIKSDSKPSKPAPSNSVKASNLPATTFYVRKGHNAHVEELIRLEAQKQGYDDITLALDIADCESRFNPKATGVNKDGTRDRGVFQINEYWHKNISDTCAYDAECNIRYAISLLKQGKAHLWACYRKVR